MAWDADHYLQFHDQRTRPALDLAARIQLANPRTLVDLGCGPGNSTQVLRQRWPEAHVLGLDSSASMIAAARQAFPDQQWVEAPLEEWSPAEPVDLLFSNAVLQWLPDHASLVRRLFGFVALGGALAFQIPANRAAPVRRSIDEIADDPLWSPRLREAREALTMEEPALYYDALAGEARSLDLWQTEYCHVLDSATAIVDWISSTGLRPILEALETPEDHQLFRSRLIEQVAEAYPRRADGRVLFPFRRLFVVAYA